MLNVAGLPLCGMLLAGGLSAAPALAGTYTPQYQFTGGNDGAVPSASLTYDEKRNLYGVAEYGGGVCSDINDFGCGSVYKLSPSGQETTLVLFTGPANGKYPRGRLTLVDHTLYGSASGGGTPNKGHNNQGVLFSVHADGTKFRLLHIFNGTDGSEPVGPLIPGPAGAFYGITLQGGPKSKNNFTGVMFELMPDGTYTQLHDFTGGADGGGPNTLLIDASGTLYGSTAYGASCRGNRSCGVVFQYVPSTATFTVLHQFTGAEGQQPMLGSIGPDGTLYGATQNTGRENPGGWLFALVPNGGTYSLTTLYAFSALHAPGTQPSGGPLLTAYGDLIGTTTYNGTLYRFKDGKMKVLYTFPTTSSPVPPILDKNGTIYGASSEGGITPCNTSGVPIGSGCGYVYSFMQ